MNLLVTNTRNGQAYCITRSLRPHAKKVVATVYGANALVARLAPTALSRMVDRVYRVPAAIDDWRRGNVQDANTPAEEAYWLAGFDGHVAKPIDYDLVATLIERVFWAHPWSPHTAA